MINGLWGKKIGMTQMFSQDNKVVPVTAIDIGSWFVTQIKTQERDGYDALQLGCIKDRYRDEDFSTQWIKRPKKYFSALREVRIDPNHDFQVGQEVVVNGVLEEGEAVDVFGTTTGKGFQGVIKRHGFAGGQATHGDQVGRTPGSIGFITHGGHVVKGKKLPGHMGTRKTVMRNLQVQKVEPDSRIVLVEGSIPGKTGSLVFWRKSG